MDRNLAKKYLFEFKKFARKNTFLENYKRHSKALKKERNLINIFEKYEPIELIESSDCFCKWPLEDFFKWSSLNYKWTQYCLVNKIYFDKKKALAHARLIGINTKKYE